MLGEAPPAGDGAGTALGRDVPDDQEPAGDQNRGKAVVSVEPSFASACAFVVKEGCRMAWDEFRERSRSTSVTDVVTEVRSFGGQLFCYVDQQACELEIVQKFEHQPLISLFPVVSVGLMMSCIGICYSFVYLPAMHLSVFSFPSTIFHASVGIAFVSYHQGVITNPGGIPSSWTGPPNGRPKFALQKGVTFAPLERKKTTNGYRYCKNEGKFKPDRAHYCKLMSQNVLKMDHYCPWLANCVGLRNYKFFLLTLFYDALAANIVNFSSIHALHVGGHSAIHVFMLSQGVVLATVTSGVLTPFFLFHCWLVSKNLTTLEYCEHGRGRSGDEHVELECPYDLGLWHNITTALGKELYLWLLPTTPTLCTDGLDFPVGAAYQHKKLVQPNMKAMVAGGLRPGGATSGEDLGTVPEEHSEDSEEDAQRRRPTTSPATAEGRVPLSRKCAAARDGAAARLNSKSIENTIERVSSGVSFCSTQIGTAASVGLTQLQALEPAMPSFVYGGLEAYQECGRDLLSYTSDKASEGMDCGRDLYAYTSAKAWDALAWWRPPAPRMKSTVSQSRAGAS